LPRPRCIVDETDVGTTFTCRHSTSKTPNCVLSWPVFGAVSPMINGALKTSDGGTISRMRFEKLRMAAFLSLGMTVSSKATVAGELDGLGGPRPFQTLQFYRDAGLTARHATHQTAIAT